MKKRARALATWLLIGAMLSSILVYADTTAPTKKEMKGLWVATVLNIDYPSKPTTNPETLKSEALSILDRAQALGLNAVFLQVRPSGDALYDSAYFPWSKYLTGTQGTAPQGGFNPLTFWVEEAHKRGIELHAWVNPYRITKKTAAEPPQDLAQLSPTHPARLNPQWTVKHTDGNYYFDPGIPEVRKLIIDSSLELVTRYGVDGIHFDDYFYPGKDFNDSNTYAKYGQGYANIDDWRRENVNALVRDLHNAITAVSPTVRFGISPFGIWANSRTNAKGSDTRGAQSYYDHYADSLTWVKEGSIDYIAPQIYWNIGYEIADYSKILNWWRGAIAGTGVDLYVGHGAYKAENKDSASPWYGTAEIQKQLALNSQYADVGGSIFYNNKALANSSALSAVIKQWYTNRSAAVVTPPTAPASNASSSVLVLGKPAGDIRTTLTSYYVAGASNPNLPLLLNGAPVSNRTSQGYFGMLIPLNSGANTLVFSQGNTSVTRVITRGGSTGGAAATMKTADIVQGSVFPQISEYLTPGDVITLSCKAPIGSSVTVTLGGSTYAMVPATAQSPGKGIYPTTFTYKYTLPTYDGSPRIVDIGAPMYTMTYGKLVKTAQAPASIGVIMAGAPMHGYVTQTVLNTYDTPSTSNGASGEIYAGMTDRITKMTGSYIQLSTGKWVSRSGIRAERSNSQLTPSVTAASYAAGSKWDNVRINLSSPMAATASQSGNTLRLLIPLAQGGPVPTLPDNGMLSSATAGATANGLEYVFTLKDGQRIDGFAIQMLPEGISLNIRRPAYSSAGSQPLKGITVMLDPGHGGKDTGAIGPLGTLYPEKSINLDLALALQAQLVKSGATVLMTRTTDTDVTLDQRLSQCRTAQPDLFISLHANSMADNVDISKISGFSAFYRDNLSAALTKKIHDTVTAQMLMNSKGVRSVNYYVTRGTWSTSMLLEAGFVPNPSDFQLLISPEGRTRMATSITTAITDYYKAPQN